MSAPGAVFDGVAAGYDAAFTHTALGRVLRRRVWEVLARYLRPGQHWLELACGTGEDALWLAGQGVRVTATDGSPRMLEIAQAKARAAGLAERIAFARLDLTAGLAALEEGAFDGVLSDFGGINVLSDWRPLARDLARLVRPGGVVVLVPMGPRCPWEVVWYGMHGDGRTATRRWRGRAVARIGAGLVPVAYPSPRRLRRDFAPWFGHRETLSLGFWLPPTALAPWCERHRRWLRMLAWLDARTARLTCGWGDHYVQTLERLT
ncbi:MAG: class I SAM-dependent methyltransferase [Anaerolineae bacterium]|nr:class I SAM-dependent methyltransferase [Caldilineales bacterium]MDW8268185.1 class I SAM-dependent methyltransferase [Anaerolineae bacterium]